MATLLDGCSLNHTLFEYSQITRNFGRPSHQAIKDQVEILGDLLESLLFLIQAKSFITATISAAPAGLHQLRCSAMD
jgi:hypothetical protein